MTILQTEIKRKIFHLTSFIYVLGTIFIERHIYIKILISLFILESLFEVLRLKGKWPASLLSRYFGTIIRTSEERRFTGVFWLLLGVIITMILIPPTPVAVGALLYVIIGDTVASLVGMRLGGPHWPGSKKTISGSLACFIACLFIGEVLLRPMYSWGGIIAGAGVATLVEYGVVPLNDNFTIPVAASLTFMFCYGIRPLFF